MPNTSKLNADDKELNNAPTRLLVLTIGASSCPNTEDGADTESMASFRREQKRMKSVVLSSVVLTLMLMGVLSIWTYYRFFLSESPKMYHAVCDIPYSTDEGKQPRFYAHDDYGTQLIGNDGQYNELVDDNYFREGIEVDGGDENGYIKIEVPVFKNANSSRFIHDFALNQSAIVDVDNNRCFIMPLDRAVILPPTSLVDDMQKRASGKYNVDMERVRQQMRVVLPAVIDLFSVSPHIASACNGNKIYMLKPLITNDIAKRSANAIPLRFAGFMGKNIVEYALINMDELESHESVVAKQQLT